MARMKTKEIQENLVETMHSWQHIEDAAVTSTNKIIEKTDNDLIRMVMEIIQNDSKMHYRVQGLIASSVTAKHTLKPEDLGEVWNSIRKHIKMEKDMVKYVEETLENIKGRKMIVQEYLLNYLKADEQKHDKLLSDLEQVERALWKAEKAAKTGKKDDIARRDALARMNAHLNSEQPARTFDFASDDPVLFREFNLLTAKPIMYIANVDEGGLAADNDFVAQVKALAQREGAEIVVVCAALEAEIAQLDDDDKAVFLEDAGLDEPGLDRVIRAGYQLLGLQTFFTAGEKEVRAWTVKVGATAPNAAGEIHTDFEKGFIRAETIAFDDYVSLKGEQGAREAGRLRAEGKEYVMHEGDVVHFLFNV